MGIPLKKISSGKVTGTLWENEFSGKKVYSYSFQKNYKTKDGEWKNTVYFDDRDLLNIKAICDTITQESIKKKIKQIEPPKEKEKVGPAMDEIPF